MLIAVVIIAVVNSLLLILLLARKPHDTTAELKASLANLEKNQERTDRLIREEIARNRDESSLTNAHLREEIAKTINIFENSLLTRISENTTSQKNQLDIFSNQLTSLTQLNEQKLDKVRSTLEERLKTLQEDNNSKLEKMRETVDEKLQTTLEKRLGESFKLVSDRLEKVHQGLGEMQTLASGVGDLKKILANVKTRGTFGEGQLANLLSEILTPDQYATNIITKKGSRDPVEFAIRLPGRNEAEVFLPIDAKFPTEDFERLQNAQDAGNLVLLEEAAKALESRLKLEAKNIRDKYLDPPHTTDFAFLFLPTESLYAEVLRRPGLADTLRREFRVVVAGPTTIVALLNSLQMGFRTLAVEKRASEVWNLLATVKTEFGKFALILENTQAKLQQASKTIEDAASKSRNIERKLKNVQEMPAGEKPLATNRLIQPTEIDAFLE